MVTFSNCEVTPSGPRTSWYLHRRRTTEKFFNIRFKVFFYLDPEVCPIPRGLMYLDLPGLA